MVALYTSLYTGLVQQGLGVVAKFKNTYLFMCDDINSAKARPNVPFHGFTCLMLTTRVRSIQNNT